MEQFLNDIKTNILHSFLSIPSTMAKIFNKEILQTMKESEEKVGDQEEKNELMEETYDSLVSSSNEDENILMQKIGTKLNEKKVAIDLFTGANAQRLLVNRIDRDVFDLIYHRKFEYNKKFNFSKLNQMIPLTDKELDNFKNYLKDVKDVLQFLKSLNMNLEGEIDFIIRNVDKKNIIGALTDESKKYFVFADENSFQDDKYDIFGEVTINLFRPSVYLQKLKQIIRYILLIKLLEKHPEYFKTLNIPPNKRAIMIVTDGNYNEFIDKLSNSKIFSKDFE